MSFMTLFFSHGNPSRCAVVLGIRDRGITVEETPAEGPARTRVRERTPLARLPEGRIAVIVQYTQKPFGPVLVFNRITAAEVQDRGASPLSWLANSLVRGVLQEAPEACHENT